MNNLAFVLGGWGFPAANGFPQAKTPDAKP